MHDGGEGRRGYDLSYRVRPLPPVGAVAFVCEWPAYEMGESRADIDAALIHEESERAVPLWPDGGHH
jgi:hypothetical protein